MAKTGLLNISANNTFQVWLDRTNELVDLMGTDVITASTLGDNTGSSGAPKIANLFGTFSANNINATTKLRADVISPLLGSTEIAVEAPVSVDVTQRLGFEITSTINPIFRVNNGSLAWDVGFESATTNFIINTGSGDPDLKLTPAGDLTVRGDIIASTFTGNVVGQVSSISNHNTDDLSEGSSNLYFSNARARGAISVSGDLTYNSATGNITLSKILSGAYSITNNSGIPLTLNDSGGTSSNVMMRFNGQGSDLDILNHNTAGDYEFRVQGGTYASSININDGDNGIQFRHTSGDITGDAGLALAIRTDGRSTKSLFYTDAAIDGDFTFQGDIFAFGDIRFTNSDVNDYIGYATQNGISYYENDLEAWRLSGAASRSSYIAHGGSFGIGTKSPSATLDVVGNAEIKGSLQVVGNSTITGFADVDRLILTNHEISDFSSDDGLVFHDASEGIYHVATNSGYNTPALLWSRANVTAGNDINITYNSQQRPTISHQTFSSQSSVNNNNGTVIQDIYLDNGHITNISSVNLDNRYVLETGDTMTGQLTINRTGTLLNLTDTSSASVDKVMMVVNGNGKELKLINSAAGDYDFVSQDSDYGTGTSLRINDRENGLEIRHVNDGTNPLNASAAFRVGTSESNVQITMSANTVLSGAVTTINNTISGTAIASEAEAEAGTRNDHIMTPLRTQQAIDQFAAGDGTVIQSSAIRPHIRYQSSQLVNNLGYTNTVEPNGDAQKLEFSGFTNVNAVEVEFHASPDPSEDQLIDNVWVDFSDDGVNYYGRVKIYDLSGNNDQVHIFLNIDFQDKEIRYGGYITEEANGETVIVDETSPEPPTTVGSLSSSTDYIRFTMGRINGGIFELYRFRSFAKLSRWGGLV